jgi:hypothetical protein
MVREVFAVTIGRKGKSLKPQRSLRTSAEFAEKFKRTAAC